MIALLTSPVGRLTALMSATFLAYGMWVPYLNLWLSETHGLDGVEIAAVTSTAALSRMLVGPLVAGWADGFDDRRRPMQILVCAGLLALTAFAMAEGFWALVVAGFVSSTTTAALTPLAEGATLRASQSGPIPFGVARATGSFAFVIGTLAGGALLAPFGVGVVMVWILAGLSIAAVVALFGLSPDPAPAGAAGRSFAARLRAAPALLARKPYRLAFLAGGAIQSAHAFYYGFSVLAWKHQGLSDGTIAGLWAFGVVCEIAGLAALPWIERRVSPETLLVLGGVGAVLRWTIFGFAPPEALLWPLQTLHALTFAAAHVGCLRIIQRETPEANAAVGQGLYASFASGTAMGCAAVLSGVLYDSVGTSGYFAMAGLGALGFWFSVALWRLHR